MNRTRKLSGLEQALVNKHLAGEITDISKRGARIYSQEQMDRAFERENADRAVRRAERAEREKAAMKNDAEYFTSDEFRADVIEELMGKGASRLQAEGRTRDQARLFNEARELGLM